MINYINTFKYSDLGKFLNKLWRSVYLNPISINNKNDVLDRFPDKDSLTGTLYSFRQPHLTAYYYTPES